MTIKKATSKAPARRPPKSSARGSSAKRSPKSSAQHAATLPDVRVPAASRRTSRHAPAFAAPPLPIQSATAAKDEREAGAALVELGDSIGYCCPSCGGELVRVHRRLIDYLWLVPVNRFRCTTLVCGHEYTLRGADA